MSIDTAPCEESAWKRRPLAEMSDATLVNFFQHPDRPVLYADIASAVPGYGSYRSIKNAVDDGHLREPVRLTARQGADRGYIPEYHIESSLPSRASYGSKQMLTRRAALQGGTATVAAIAGRVHDLGR